MTKAKALLQSYLDTIRAPAVAATPFTDDGIVELPTAKAAHGPMAFETSSRRVAG